MWRSVGRHHSKLSRFSGSGNRQESENGIRPALQPSMSTRVNRDRQADTLFEDRVDRVAVRIRDAQRASDPACLLTLDEARTIARRLLQETTRQDQWPEQRARRSSTQN